jgi:hypothetical protein
MINANPKIFIVKGKNQGIRVTLDFDTNRQVNRSAYLRNDTEREIHRTEVLKNDTARLVHNQRNIQFETLRKINREIGTRNDTLRRVKSNLPVYYHSFYVHAVDGKPIECVIFKNTSLFPFPTKYVKVQLDSNNEYGYLPLAPVGSEYDSGMRYTEDKDGTIWQICSTITYNIFDEYFINDNYFINVKDYDYLYTAMRNIFDSRVEMGEDCIYLTTPQQTCGITKMFMIGLDLRITWTNDGSEDWDNGITLTTHNNGICDTSYDGDNKYKANAMLVKFEPRKKYKIQFYNKYMNISYDVNEVIKGCIIFGRDVEKLPEVSANYSRLINTNEYCTTGDSGIIVPANNKNYIQFKMLNKMKNSWLNYTNTRRMYDFYDLVHITYEDTKK